MSSEKIRLPILVERSVAEASIARTKISQEYDAALRNKLEEGGLALSCTKGCNSCCHYPVMVSIFEGISLYRWLYDNQLWTTSLKKRLAEAVDRVKGLSLEVWLLSMIPCALLTPEGTCSVYQARPFACRVTYSIGDPEYCHPHRMGEDSGMLPKKVLFEVLEQEEAQLLRPHHSPHFRLPLAKALLLGEQVSDGDIALEDTLAESFR